MVSGNSSSPPLGEKLYEGKAKIIYATDDPAVLITYFKDDATAFNAQKRGRAEPDQRQIGRAHV